MSEIQRAKIILKILNKTYPKITVPLKSRNIFTLLISVLLSAQCTDVNVNNVTKKIYPKYYNPYHFQKLGRKTHFHLAWEQWVLAKTVETAEHQPKTESHGAPHQQPSGLCWWGHYSSSWLLGYRMVKIPRPTRRPEYHPLQGHSCEQVERTLGSHHLHMDGSSEKDLQTCSLSGI